MGETGFEIEQALQIPDSLPGFPQTIGRPSSIARGTEKDIEVGFAGEEKPVETADATTDDKKADDKKADEPTEEAGGAWNTTAVKRALKEMARTLNVDTGGRA